MDNAEEILQALEEFSKLKPKDIPKELDEYLGYVAKTGDPVYQWHLVKYLFHEKLLNVITEFFETSPTLELPPCPNVDPFNYERMKTSLLERLDMFSSAPFTVQRICELLTNPRKQYNRVDKFMRAVEKNILVVSTREPGAGKRLESDQTDSVPNGIPDCKINETEDRIGGGSDTAQFDNSSESQIPVENAVNACVIQEEIEIANSVTATSTVIATDTKAWREENKTANVDIKTDVADNTEINVVSTTCINVSIDPELPKNTNILFTEDEMKDDKSVDNEPNSSTINSIGSPEPSAVDNVSNADLDETTKSNVDISEDSCSSNTEEQNEPQSNENIAEVKECHAKENTEEQENEIIDTNNSNAEVAETELCANNEVLEEDVTTESKVSSLSPDNIQPDSSNDSYQITDDDTKTVNNDVKVEQESVSIDNDDVTINSEENISTDVADVTSSQAPDQQEEVASTEELVVKEIDEEDIVDDTDKTEVVKCIVEDSNEANEMSANDETVASSEDCISIEEISDKGESVNSSDKDQNEVGTSITCNEVCEEQERREESVIHITSNVTGMENESHPANDIPVICGNRPSCTEDEAMDVDETSNHQMVTSEGESEVEPMEQSES